VKYVSLASGSGSTWSSVLALAFHSSSRKTILNRRIQLCPSIRPCSPLQTIQKTISNKNHFCSGILSG